jgi:hypothetical protein
MENEQAQWAAQLREIPVSYRKALYLHDEQIIRFRPAAGEWSAIEVVGHMVDKMFHWSRRVERIWHEYRPTLPGFDQDEVVRAQGYQEADPDQLLEKLREQCNSFAALVESLPDEALERVGIHSEYGPLTIKRCIQLPLGSVQEHLEQLDNAQQGGLTVLVEH